MHPGPCEHVPSLKNELLYHVDLIWKDYPSELTFEGTSGISARPACPLSPRPHSTHSPSFPATWSCPIATPARMIPAFAHLFPSLGHHLFLPFEERLLIFKKSAHAGSRTFLKTRQPLLCAPMARSFAARAALSTPYYSGRVAQFLLRSGDVSGAGTLFPSLLYSRHQTQSLTTG